MLFFFEKLIGIDDLLSCSKKKKDDLLSIWKIITHATSWCEESRKYMDDPSNIFFNSIAVGEERPDAWIAKL